MDCQNARDQLEAVRPDSEDRNSPDFAAASVHLLDCPDCEAVIQHRRGLDVRVSELMLSVAVPVGLRDRLFAALGLEAGLRVSPVAGAESGIDSANRPAAPQAVISRRGFERVRYRILSAVAVSAAILAGLFFAFPKETVVTSFTMADVRRDANLHLAELAEFDGSFTPRFPSGYWVFEGGPIRIAKKPKGDFRGPDGRHRAAFYRFLVASQERMPDGTSRLRKDEGVLIVIPRSTLDDPPRNEQFDASIGEGVYAQRKSGNFHMVSWSEGDFVYVCFMKVGSDDKGMKALRWAVKGNRA